MEKTCSKCGKVKDSSEFRYDKRMKLKLKSQCKQCEREYATMRLERDRININARRRQNRKNNLDECRRKDREYDRKNPDKIKARKQRYRSTEKGKKKEREHKLRYHKFKMETDELYKCEYSTRHTIKSSFSRMGYSKDSLTCLILGLEWKPYMKYIEDQFDENMSWENHGTLWDFDHIIPIKYAMTHDEIMQLNHYTNFQPMDSYENQAIKKDNVFHDLDVLDRILNEWI